jgi:hypothetical protein
MVMMVMILFLRSLESGFLTYSIRALILEMIWLRYSFIAVSLPPSRSSKALMVSSVHMTWVASSAI